MVCCPETVVPAEVLPIVLILGAGSVGAGGEVGVGGVTACGGGAGAGGGGEEELALVEVGEEFQLCEVVVQGWVFLVFLEDT